MMVPALYNADFVFKEKWNLIDIIAENEKLNLEYFNGAVKMQI